ncbi:hypothetical protein T459_09440 [Capsicum annuum]|uniref:PGG domain-containing protein n=1 Tax=Capsicum annuum TaxID=4072 RepID=A0A2G2ZZC5_CAPAN|nr:hypothetical protein T459_09440 [Capsicum annuum]
MGNTILHVAAHYGHSNFVAEVLKITPALLCNQNRKNETVLHIEANEGHIEVVHLLFSIEDHYKEKLMRMTDENGAPTLHKAVRSRHEDVASFLVKEDPEFEFPSNKEKETPMYLAAKSSLREALVEILNSCKKPTSSTDPLNRTPLHAAVIQEHTRMEILIRKSAFRAFVITDAITFTCSAGAIFIYFYMETNPRPRFFQDLSYLWSLSKVRARSQLVAMPAVVIAFVTGMHANLAHSVGLAVTVCAFGYISFIMYVWEVLRPVCWISLVKE